MRRHLLALFCPLLLTACSADVAVDTPPQSAAIPVTSVLEPAYAEVAIDMPSQTQELDVTVKELSATLTVYNPSKAFTMKTSARLSLTGTATPSSPKFYTRNTLPAYYDTADELIPESPFAAGTRTPVTIGSPALMKTLGKERIWVIVSNTATQAGPGGDVLPLEIRLEDIVLHAIVTKSFEGLEGALGPGGL